MLNIYITASKADSMLMEGQTTWGIARFAADNAVKVVVGYLKSCYSPSLTLKELYGAEMTAFIMKNEDWQALKELALDIH